jgi:hypothetical protein
MRRPVEITGDYRHVAWLSTVWMKQNQDPKPLGCGKLLQFYYNPQLEGGEMDGPVRRKPLNGNG